MSCMHQNFKKRSYKIKYLREKFNCVESYEKISEFKRNVLDTAIADVEKHTPIEITYEQKKVGRKVTEIVFSFKDTSNGKLYSPQTKPDATDEDGNPIDTESENSEKSIEQEMNERFSSPYINLAEEKKKSNAEKEPKKPQSKDDWFASKAQRDMFAKKLSRLPQLSHLAKGNTNSYEAFAEYISNELADKNKRGFYKPYLDMVEFNSK